MSATAVRTRIALAVNALKVRRVVLRTLVGEVRIGNSALLKARQSLEDHRPRLGGVGHGRLGAVVFKVVVAELNCTEVSSALS